jgi:protein-disulfide isomerase
VSVAKKKAAAAEAAKRMRIFYAVLAVVAVAGIGGIAWAIAGQWTGGAITGPVELGDVAGARALMEMARPEIAGDTDAPVQLIVFSDFECPYCAQFALQVKPPLRDNYVNDGSVQIVYYDFPLPNHRQSFIAARAARCAGDQDRFWEYHDLLLAEQAAWARRANAMDDFLTYADRLGLDRSGFGACLRSDRHALTVTANLHLAERLGVTGTPTVFVNGRRIANWSYGELARHIDGELGR